MNEFMVVQIYKGGLGAMRPWRQRRQQGIHTPTGNVQFVEATNKADAARKVSLRDSFMFDMPKTFMVLTMRNADFFEVDVPIINIREGNPS